MHVKPSGVALGEVRSEDVLTVDLDGQLMAGTRPMHVEMPIHTRIYARRVDVNAIVHTHALHVAAFAASAADFRMVNQDSIYFADGIGFHASSKLVVTIEQGDALATALSDKKAVVLKNHGLVAVGRTIQEAVFLADAFVNSLRVQVMAAQFGPLSPIAPDELAETACRFKDSYERRVNSTWEYLSRLLSVSE
jgi:L-fuculose-phosphate aldolase